MSSLSIKRVSASEHTTVPRDVLRSNSPTYAKLVDISRCIGCKGCEVACKEWNDLKVEPTANFGSYQSHRDLTPNTWLLMRFNEVDVEGNLQWLITKDACLHCAEPGCLYACPAPGAIVQYANGIVDINQDQCIGCQYCVSGCPFNVPRFDRATRTVSKCNMCVDRVESGLEPACVIHRDPGERTPGGPGSAGAGGIELSPVRLAGRARHAERQPGSERTEALGVRTVRGRMDIPPSSAPGMQRTAARQAGASLCRVVASRAH